MREGRGGFVIGTCPAAAVGGMPAGRAGGGTSLLGWRRMLLPAIALFFCVWAPAQTALADPVVFIQPSNPVAQVGQPFAIDIVGRGMTDLYAFQFSLGFNSTVISANGIREGTLLSGGGATFFIPGTADNNAGTISLTASTLIGPVPGVSGSGVLATVIFTGLTSGESLINLSDVTLLDSNLSPIRTDVQSGSIRVESVPEPTTALLLCIGLAGLITARKLKRQRER
jgi:hypothetical protein